MIKALSYALLCVATLAYGVTFIHEVYQRNQALGSFVTPVLATLVFGLVTWLFSRTISKFKKPWWTGTPLILSLFLQCAMLIVFASASLTDPNYSPTLEFIPFIYWIISGVGVTFSYIALSIVSFFEGYRNESPTMPSGESSKTLDH